MSCFTTVFMRLSKLSIFFRLVNLATVGTYMFDTTVANIITIRCSNMESGIGCLLCQLSTRFVVTRQKSNKGYQLLKQYTNVEQKYYWIRVGLFTRNCSKYIKY